jgi:diguanylate cyclase (GGDEF)-like protein
VTSKRLTAQGRSPVVETAGIASSALTPTSWAARWMWLVVLIAGGGAITAYFAAPDPLSLEMWYLGIGTASTACVLFGIRLHRPANGAAWWLIAAGNLCFVVGDGIFAVYELGLHQDPPVPSVADLFYLAGYPLLVVGLVRLRQHREHIGSREDNADAAIVSMAVLALSWRTLMSSYAEDPSLGGFGKLVTMAYPIMDVGIIFIVMSSLLFGGGRSMSLRLIAVAMVAMLITDFGYDLIVLHSTYNAGNAVDAGWLINYVLIAAAALHPSMATQPHRKQSGARRGWVPTVLVAGLTPPAIVLVGGLQGSIDDLPVYAGISAALFALVVLRSTWLLRRVSAQNAELEHRTALLQDSLSMREVLEGDLRHQAFHDPLTGLPNRNLLYDRVEHALATAVRSRRSVVMYFCDLDLFKNINDGLGHSVGDQVLMTVARRLQSAVRTGDTVARLNGDEFAVLLEDVDDDAIAFGIADRILAVLREPMYIGDHVVRVSASIGVAFDDPGPTGTAASILEDADAAMYEAKAAGRDRYQIFERAMRTRITHRLEMTNAFKTALESGQFVLEYQPDYVLRTGYLHGFEALVRWNHPTLGRVGPCDFIPLAEETGFIVPLGRWVLETACIAATTWSAQPDHALTVAVNLSVRQLQHTQLVDDVRMILAITGLPAGQLVLEVTESALMTDPASAAATLAQLRALGIRIAIDDFGTGHSSLSYLRQFPIDILKIDKSFVDPLADPAQEGTAFVATILQLARDLGLTTIAEGIEHPNQQTTLTELGCDQAQGYLLSVPLPADGARRLTESTRRTPPSTAPAASDQRTLLEEVSDRIPAT